MVVEVVVDFCSDWLWCALLDDDHYANLLQYACEQQTHSAAPPVQQVIARHSITGTVKRRRIDKTG